MQERMFCAEGNVSSCFREGEKAIWKAYVRRGMNSEKGQMKLRLLDWGCTVERCRRLQEELRRLEVPLESGVFGADMQIDHVNDGPVTILLDTECFLARGI